MEGVTTANQSERPRVFRFAIAAIVLAACLGTTGVCATRLLQGRAVAREGEQLAQLLELKPGAVTADVGAGDGEWTRELSKQVGADGHVFATEIDRDLVRKLEASTSAAGNVTVVLGTQKTTGLEAGCCDAILLRLVYHHFADPSAMHADLLKALRPRGLIAIVDFEPNGGSLPSGVPGNRGSHGIKSELVVKEMTGAGFELVRREDDWPGDDDRYCLILRKK